MINDNKQLIENSIKFYRERIRNIRSTIDLIKAKEYYSYSSIHQIKVNNLEKQISKMKYKIKRMYDTLRFNE